MKTGYLDLDEYNIASELHKCEQDEARKVAIGLQAVNKTIRTIVEGSPKGHRRIIEGTKKENRINQIVENEIF